MNKNTHLNFHLHLRIEHGINKYHKIVMEKLDIILILEILILIKIISQTFTEDGISKMLDSKTLKYFSDKIS